MKLEYINSTFSMCKNYVINVQGIKFIHFPNSRLLLNLNNIESISLKGNQAKEYIYITLLNSNKVIEIWSNECFKINSNTQYLFESKEYINWVKKRFQLGDKQ